MDSFYDAPRRAPMPTKIEKFLPAPVVPEVSIIGLSKTTTRYSAWKIQQNRAEDACILSPNRGNILKGPQILNQNENSNSQNTSHLLKKQVRFESPILQQRPSLTYEHFNTRKIAPQNCINASKEINSSPKSLEESDVQKNVQPSVAFQPRYVANVPNKNLDLSLIDVPNRVNNMVEKENREKLKDANIVKTKETNINTFENKENMLPRTYRGFLETQKKIVKENKDVNDSVTDIFNYGRKRLDSENFCSNKKFCDFATEPIARKPIDINYVSANKISNGSSEFIDSVSSKLHVEKTQMQPQFNEINRCSDFRQQHFQNRFMNYTPKCDKITQTSLVYTSARNHSYTRNNSEPTNRDLLKIIAQQNEQLLILQKQVAMLLSREDQHHVKQIEPPPLVSQRMHYKGEKCITSSQNEAFGNPMQDINSTPRKQRGMSKFSIDLMTSFEVAIRPQHNKQNYVNQEPKIQEITESESAIKDNASAADKVDKTLVDTSLHLQEPVKVREMCPSPEPSININMNDYDSSDDDEVSASEIGATFYRNLMGQVNDILRKAQVQAKEELKDGQNCVDKFKNQTMNRVKEATLKHLKNIGVTIGPIEEVDEVVSMGNDGNNFTPTEISFAVKQLLLKYLPDDQLAKITYKKAQPVPTKKAAKPGIISTRPEFSFASVQYMKKYNLISNNPDSKPVEIERISKPANAQKQDGPKILDITALKMQPKLL